MSDTTLVTLVATVLGAIPTTIAALAAYYASKAAALKAERAASLSEQTADTSAALVVKTDEIHALVNSQLTAVKSELAVANQQIRELQSLIVKLTERETLRAEQDIRTREKLEPPYPARPDRAEGA